MENTPVSMRKHVVITGKTNAGKSTLLNSLLGQETSIVSEIKGTTTDPVLKAMELIPYGPIALIDTAGIGDDTALGLKRTEKTKRMLDRADLVISVKDASEADVMPADTKLPYILVFTKCDKLSTAAADKLKEEYPDAVFMSDYCKTGLEELKGKMIAELKKQDRDDDTFIGDLLPEGSTVVLVTPIDSAAPKGRLILPQVQILRDCLDNNMTAYVTKENTLKDALDNLKKVDLVITDSQAFKLVNEIVPPSVPLTSFSMILARKKGNFKQFLDGAEHILKLKSGDRVLVLEGCTHNTTHEDIGKVKLPKLIEKRTGAKCVYEHRAGYDFPDNLDGYSLALSCGMCMINKQEINSRLEKLKKAGVPVVNYGIALAYLNGILDRAKAILKSDR